MGWQDWEYKEGDTVGHPEYPECACKILKREKVNIRSLNTSEIISTVMKYIVEAAKATKDLGVEHAVVLCSGGKMYMARCGENCAVLPRCEFKTFLRAHTHPSGIIDFSINDIDSEMRVAEMEGEPHIACVATPEQDSDSISVTCKSLRSSILKIVEPVGKTASSIVRGLLNYLDKKFDEYVAPGIATLEDALFKVNLTSKFSDKGIEMLSDEDVDWIIDAIKKDIVDDTLIDALEAAMREP